MTLRSVGGGGDGCGRGGGGGGGVASVSGSEAFDSSASESGHGRRREARAAPRQESEGAAPAAPRRAHHRQRAAVAAEARVKREASLGGAGPAAANAMLELAADGQKMGVHRHAKMGVSLAAADADGRAKHMLGTHWAYFNVIRSHLFIFGQFGHMWSFLGRCGQILCIFGNDSECFACPSLTATLHSTVPRPPAPSGW
jgi:hypothetical protein